MTEGPIEKSIATIQLENLMRKLMQPSQLTIGMTETQDVIFNFDSEHFNWSEIIKNARLEHIVLKETDFTLYQNYMESLKQTDLIDEEEMFAFFPTLEPEKISIYQDQLYNGIQQNNPISFEEMSAINIYTGILFFASINDLARGSFSFSEEGSLFKSKTMEIRHAIIQLVMCASGLNKLSLPSVMSTYRGESLYYSQEDLNRRIKATAQNKVITLKGLVSTNITNEHQYTQKEVQYAFHNVRGICIAPISRFPSIEQELIMVPTQIQLLRYEYKNKQHFFEARCVRDLDSYAKIARTSGLTMSSH